MARCSAITRQGERCKGMAIDASGLCHAHHPDRADVRKQAGSKGGKRGGRGRPQAELSSIKARLESLADDVLSGRVERSDAAVVAQIFGTVIRAVKVEIEVREQQELEARIQELEDLLNRRNERRRRRYGPAAR